MVLNMDRISSEKKPKVEYIEVIGGLAGNAALDIQTRLYQCLDEGRFYQIMDLEHVNQIDGLGIAILENFIIRGLQIRLMNVRPEVESFLRIANKESFFHLMYSEKDRLNAVSLFEKEIREKKVMSGDAPLKKRSHIRVNTLLPVEFSVPGKEGFDSISVSILNLSEGGALVAHRIAEMKHPEEYDNCRGVTEGKVCELTFKLNDDSIPTTFQGTCVREFMAEELRYAGIHFNKVSHQQKESIRSFVDNYNTKRQTSGDRGTQRKGSYKTA